METTTNRRTLSEVCQRITEVATLPHIAVRAVQVANDPDAGAAEMKAILEQDVALSVRVLRIVNSSAYAVRSEITNLQHAIAYLGVQRVRNLAMTTAVSRLFQDRESIASYRRSDLWDHLVSVGVCARMIAQHLKRDDSEEIFLAGLLHDLGIILEDQYLPTPFAAAIRDLEGECSLCAAEYQHLGFDHTMLGEALAAQWGFPEAARAGIRYHHDSGSYGGASRDAVRCVEVANVLCTLKGISSVGQNRVAFPQAAFEGLALGRDDLGILAGGLEAELAKHEALFQVGPARAW